MTDEQKQRAADKKLSMYPLSFEEALRGALQVERPSKRTERTEKASTQATETHRRQEDSQAFITASERDGDQTHS
jgi:hypothetical protein